MLIAAAIMSLYKYFKVQAAPDGDISETDSSVTDGNDGSACDQLNPPDPKQPRVESDTVLHCQDIASCINILGSGSDIPDVDKYELLTNHFKPGVDYTFPKIANGRSFQLRWLNMYPWLVYSQQVNGGFCLPCVLFAAKCGYHSSEPGLLVQRPLTKFGKALELLRKHSEKEHHKLAVVRSDGFISVFSGHQHSLQCQLDKVMAERIATNRERLKSIVNTVVLCGRQNIPLRGHHDSGTDVEKRTFTNHGNFWALLKFRVEAGDKVLEEHLSTAARNATYTSADIQNQIIAIIGEHIRDLSTM